jgi:ppGpp synthetase/RelA/SpoT-type nucleotidyltranferase
MDEAEARTLGHQYAAERPGFERAAITLKALLTQVCEGADVEIEPIETRAKTVDSVVEKLQRKDEFDSLDKMTDRLGGRVVTRFLVDVDTVGRLIEENFDVIADWVHGQDRLESFGYASRHMLIQLPRAAGAYVAEIQVRSVLQHAWAAISHSLDYKSQFEVPSKARHRLFRVAALLETADEIFGSFREEVEAARSEYRYLLEEGGPRDTLLTLDSLRAGIAEMGIAQIRGSAENCGWRRVSAEGTEPGFLERLFRTATAAGITNLSEVLDVATRAEADTRWLWRVADAYRQATAGSSPAAVPTDVITVRILSERATAETVRAAREAKMSLPLIEVATHTGPTTAGGTPASSS